MKILLFIALLMFSTISYSSTPVRVLIYHQTTNSIQPSQTSITEEMMARHLDKIRSLGYTTVKISEAVDHINGKIQLPPKSVAITFDDGWKNNLSAVRMLSERNMSATFYVMSGHFDSGIYFSKQDVIDISRNRNFEIGAHSHTHFMEWEGRMSQADTRVIIGEMVMSKSIIESVIGKSVTSFAWPFGYVRKEALEIAKDIGYTSTVHVNSITTNVRGSNSFLIERINIDGNCSEFHLEIILTEGKYIECK